ncbi:MAG TPA: histidine kinase [Streptosporangiaceae bacterium]|nr:histidine kinase [Streptosporangiaceae bacterium]
MSDGEFAALLGLLDPAEALRVVASTAPDVTGLDTAWIGVASHDVASMGLHYFQQTHIKELDGLVVPAGWGLGGKVLATGRPGFVADYVTSPVITHQFDPEVEAEGLHGMIAVPIEFGDRRLGVLFGSNRSVTDFGDRAFESMQAVARQAAAAATVAERARHAAEVAVFEERQRLSLDLHDSVGAMLFAITAGVRSLGQELATLPALRSRIEAIEGQALEASQMLRQSLRALSSTPEEIALAVTLRADARAFEDRAGCPARVIILSDLPPLREAQARALTECVREALLNVERHASARSVVLTAAVADGGITVAVADDGQGLDPGRAGHTGLGLRAARDRVGRLGGHLTVTGNEDGGVTFRAWVPL